MGRVKHDDEPSTDQVAAIARRAKAVHPWPFRGCDDPPSDGGFEFRSAKRFDAVGREIAQDIFAHDGQTVAEVKEDGWRVLIAQHPRGVINQACYSRGVSVETGTYRDLLTAFGIIDCLDDVALMPGCAVEAELIWPGHRAAEVPTALKEHRDELRVVCFGYPYYEGRPIASWREQRALMEEEEFPVSRIFMHEPWRLSAKELDDYAKKWDVEGWMIKDCGSSGLWWKHKRELTVDVIVCDTKDAKFGLTGKFDGQVGSLVVGVLCLDHDRRGDHECYVFKDDPAIPAGTSVRVREVANVSGMDDKQRLWMTAHREELYYRVCEIECQAVGNHERLRHPRFVRWREDKPAAECDGSEIGPPWATFDWASVAGTGVDMQDGEWRWRRFGLRPPWSAETKSEHRRERRRERV